MVRSGRAGMVESVWEWFGELRRGVARQAGQARHVREGCGLVCYGRCGAVRSGLGGEVC